MGLKRRLRSAVEAAAQAAGLVSLMERRMGRGLTVLMYHRVLPDEACKSYPFPSLVMPATAFRGQLEWLAQRAEVLPLGSALERADAPSSGRPRVAVTFDDGYADNHDLAAPIAEDLGLKLTFFVTTDFVLEGQTLWFDRAHALLERAPPQRRVEAWSASDLPGRPALVETPTAWIERLKFLGPLQRQRFLERIADPTDGGDACAETRPMSEADLRALHAAGHEIASHGTGHSVLTTLSEEELAHELEASRRLLEDVLGSPPEGLAYPNGDHDDRVRAAARRAGYAWACTTRSGVHLLRADPMSIPRRDVTPASVLDDSGRTDMRAFRCEISGLRSAWRKVRAA